MTTRFLGLVLGLTLSFSLPSAAISQTPAASSHAAIKAADFNLKDQNGRAHRLYDLKDKAAVVLIWQGVGCPIVQQTTPSIKDAAALYTNRNIAFLMINSNLQDNPESIRKEAASFGLDLPILKDSDQKVGRRLGIERTAEVVVLDPKHDWTVLYHGPLDDRLTYGRARAKADHTWTTDVLDAVLAGKRVPYTFMRADGCIITYGD